MKEEGSVISNESFIPMGRIKKFSFNLRRWFPRTTIRRIVIVSMGIILWISIVLPAFLVFNVGHDDGNSLEMGSIEIEDRVDISIYILSVNPSSRTAQFLVQMDPQGTFRNENHTLSETIGAFFRVKSQILLENKPIDSITITVPFLEGSVRDFPFDKYIAYLPVQLRNINNEIIPFHSQISGSVPSLHVNFYEANNENLAAQKYFPNGAKIIKIEVYRNPTTFIFSCLVCCVMWALAISMANLAYDVLVFNRVLAAPLLSLGVSMLFALPALRNSQPGIPQTGCASDALGFFWCLIIIAFSAVSLILSYALRWHAEFNRTR